jgi:PAS domain S-box-containing protein
VPNALPPAFLIARLDGEIVACNSSALRRWGWSREELLGKNLGDLIPFLQGFHGLELPQLTREWSARGTVKCCNGDAVTGTITASPLFNEKGRFEEVLVLVSSPRT